MKKRTKKRGAPRSSKGSTHAAAVRAAGRRHGSAGSPWSPTVARLAMYDAGVSVARLSPDDLATLEAIHHHAHATARRSGGVKKVARKATKKAAKKATKKAAKKATKKAAKKATKKAAKKARKKAV